MDEVADANERSCLLVELLSTLFSVSELQLAVYEGEDALDDSASPLVLCIILPGRQSVIITVTLPTVTSIDDPTKQLLFAAAVESLCIQIYSCLYLLVSKLCTKHSHHKIVYILCYFFLASFDSTAAAVFFLTV